MARYNDAVCRLCRRAGEKLFLKGERCTSPKCAVTRRAFAPGMHGNGRRRRVSDYGLQLREKQKAKATYGILEKQFRRYYDLASSHANTGFTLLAILERRLDNVIYRAGLAQSRAQARQLVSHGHFGVNDRRVGIPSYQVKPGDLVKAIDAPEGTAVERPTLPAWLDEKDGGALVSEITGREQIETSLNEQLIVEYYSR